MSTQTKICALLRQTWYETAKRNLKPEERLRFYETIFEYEFEDMAPAEDLPFGARLLFDMVKDDIDSDKERAQERRARARENGSKGGRPIVTVGNTAENNPKKPAGLSGFLNTVQYNTVPNKTGQECSEDSHTRFLIALDFFERGCSAPLDELEKFWGYYASLGWKTKTGADIVDRLALARAWRLADCSAASMKRRAPWVDLLRKSGAVELKLIGDFVDIKRNATKNTLEITLIEQSTAILFDNTYLPKLLQWIPKDQNGKRFNVVYKVTATTLD